MSIKLKLSSSFLLTVLLSSIFVICSLDIVAQTPSPWDKGQAELTGSENCPIAYPDFFVRERETLGYCPRFQPGMLSFNRSNVPVISSGILSGISDGSNHTPYPSRFYTAKHYLQVLNPNGKWEIVTSHRESVRQFLKLATTDILELQTGERVNDAVEFDSIGNAYTIVGAQYILNGKTSWGQYLLSSTDGMKTWQVLTLSGSSPRLEPYRFHADRKNPPAIVVLINGGIALYLPNRNTDGKLSSLVPIQLTDSSLNPLYHSTVMAGAGNHCITACGKTFIVFMSQNASTSVVGSLQYVVSYDHTTQKVEGPVLLGSTGNIVDGHNSPVVDIDSKGYVYVMGGAHWHSFKLWQSKEVGKITAGWSDPVALGGSNDNDWSRNGLTYPGFVIDHDDVMHLIVRGRSSNLVNSDPNDPKNSSNYGSYFNYALVYFRKKSGEQWESRRDLVIPKWMGYSNWYHKVFIDRSNRLFVTYYYYTQTLTTEAQQKYLSIWPEDLINGSIQLKAHDPVVIMSSNQGDTWKIAQTSDFMQGFSVNSSLPIKFDETLSSVKAKHGAILVSTSKAGLIKVYTLLGQSVASMNVASGQFEVPLRPGVYLVNFISGGKVECAKVIVQESIPKLLH